MNEFNGKPQPLIISGYSSQDLGQNIADELGSSTARVHYEEFDDGEIRTELKGNVRGREVVVVASGSGDPNTQEKETRLLMRSANETGAKSVTLLLPYMFYGRSDSDFDTRSTAGLADTIATFRDLCDQAVIVDPHNHGITKRAFLEGRTRSCVPLHMAYPFAVQLRDLFNQQVISKENMLLTYPDVGASKRITRSFRSGLYNILDLGLDPEKSDEWAQVIKSRHHETGAISVNISTDVAGRDIVMFEDMIASGGTACDIAELLKTTSSELKNGGARSVTLFSTTGLFTSKKINGVRQTTAIDRINESRLDAVFITDTYNYRATHPHLHDAIEASPVIHTINSAPYLAAVINAMHMEVTADTDENDNSISAILRGRHKSQHGHSRSIARAVPLKPHSPLLALKPR